MKRANISIAIIFILAVLLMSGCTNNEVVEPKSEEELQAEPELADDTVDTAETAEVVPVAPSPAVQEPNQTDQSEEIAAPVFPSATTSDIAISNLILEGADLSDYESAKAYVDKIMETGMEVTLADTLAVFNRCGFEYYGCDVYDFDKGLLGDDPYSDKVLKTSDGDVLYYIQTEYSDYDSTTSGYENYMLWRVNDTMMYNLLCNDTEVGGKMMFLRDYDVVGNDFPVGEENAEQVKDSLRYSSDVRLRLMKNSVYAAHGRIFNSPDLSGIFDSCSWYHAEVDPNDFDKNVSSYLTEDELDYVNIIAAEEKERQSMVNEAFIPEYTKATKLINGSYLDVNRDGNKDRVIWGWKDKSYINVFVKLQDEEELSFEFDGVYVYFDVYFADSDYIGPTFMVSQYGDSDDPVTPIYSIDNNKLVYHGDVYVSPAEVEFYDDHIVAGFRGGLLNTEEIRTKYVLDIENKFVISNNGYYEYRGNTVTLLTDVWCFSYKMGPAGPTIPAGSELVILGGDEESWVEVMDVASTLKFWLKVERSRVIFPDGKSVSVSDAFDGLIIYD